MEQISFSCLIHASLPHWKNFSEELQIWWGRIEQRIPPKRTKRTKRKFLTLPWPHRIWKSWPRFQLGTSTQTWHLQQWSQNKYLLRRSKWSLQSLKIALLEAKAAPECNFNLDYCSPKKSNKPDLCIVGWSLKRILFFAPALIVGAFSMVVF